MTEIVSGLNIKEVAEGGTVFELKYDDSPKEDDITEEKNCSEALQNYLKLECLDVNDSYDGDEPFQNIAKEMHNLLQNGKIKKRIIREGYGLKPELFTNVMIHYNAYVQYEAQPFDSTYARKKSFCFIAGEGQVIEGLEIAVLSMRLNEKSQFLIDPELAYRNSGLNRIPPNSVVLFEIELCEVREFSGQNPSESNDKDFAQVYPKCLALCVKGKNMFRLKDYHGAVKEYSTAAEKLENAILNDYDDQLKSEELLVRLYTNLLISNTQAQIPKRGCVYAQKIYQMAKNKTFKVSAKVYFNHAKCHKMLGNFNFAISQLKKAQNLEPKNPEIQQELAALRKSEEMYKKQEKHFGKALLSG
jgi:FK506-binding protein 6